MKFNVAKVLESIFPIVDQSVSTILSHAFRPLFVFCLFLPLLFYEHHCHSGGGEDNPSMSG